MNSSRSGLLAAIVLFLVLGCGGGGGDNSDGSSNATAICFNCGSGTAGLQCRILNASRPQCDVPASGGGPPPFQISFALASPAARGSFLSGNAIEVIVPNGTNVAALIAVYAFSGSGSSDATFAVEGIAQTSGVTVNDFTQPVTYALITNSGTIARYVVTVKVARATNIWTWISGSNIPDPFSTVGSSTDNERRGAVTWIDSAGSFWLFGGFGRDRTTFRTLRLLSDICKFDGSQWSCFGLARPDHGGVYGTRNVAERSNRPGGREGAVSWKDARGHLWLFGGYGVDSTGTTGYLNDLWRFDGFYWTWVSGSNLANQPAAYGTRGVPSPTNVPGARSAAASWIDASGSFWLFGGNGLSLTNDLWKFDGSNWTWVGGSNLGGQAGTYGTKGISSPSNIPGARANGAAFWRDGAGNMWLFGGRGYAASNAALGSLNDLWKFDGANWTWVRGADVLGQRADYGTKGTAAPSNDPGARDGAAFWTDASGALWLYSGTSVGGVAGELDDLWRFDGTNWTWVGGSRSAGIELRYVSQGLPVIDSPYPRRGGVATTDAAGRAWLFGGEHRGSPLSDLVRYQP